MTSIRGSFSLHCAFLRVCFDIHVPSRLWLALRVRVYFCHFFGVIFFVYTLRVNPSEGIRYTVRVLMVDILISHRVRVRESAK